MSAVARPLRRLAIVNRGEAALRCVRAVKALRAREGSDLRAIALYTAPDRDAPFARHADQALPLASERGAVAAYLDHDGVLRALREAGADSVWPGWGFVAEDPVFVERLDAEGLVFLGPSAAAMRAVGDKITAKQLAEAAGVPVTPWSGGPLRDAEHAARCAGEIGYPVALKASAGGGGRGIRMLDGPEPLAEAFRSAGAEAESAFGDGRLFVEKKVSAGRHVEVQVVADAHGTALALGCRDCSVQRRHQKVIEEGPPPGLSASLRAALEEAAVLLARRVGYCGVGTVEFLVSGDGFFFLEVNPRLQVEHGITEELTGIDLVELQIRIARGERLDGLRVRERGVAIEARVCAEDPDAGFLPAPGRVARFDPALGSRVRIDAGVAAGTRIPSDFDSLVAKVIAVGDDREEARARLACALRDFELVIEGGATNKGFLLDLLDAPEYRAGPVDTGWLDRWCARREADCGEREPDLLVRDALVAAAILAYQRSRAAARLNFYADPSTVSAERVPPSRGQQIDLSTGGESYRLEVYAIGSWRYRVHLDGRVVAATMREEEAHSARLYVGDRTRRILHDASEAGLRVEVEGHPFRYGWQTVGHVRAGTPAMVVSVDVAPGDRVRVGQPLGLLEAMKMEIGFQAPVGGVVTEVRVRRGQQVSAGDVLLVIDPAAEEGAPAGARRLALPEEPDPLALVFRDAGGAPREPDLPAADRADLAARRRAIDAAREETRRVLLGYDANAERLESLEAFLEAPLPEGLSEAFLAELAEIRHELTTFADIEQLFIRSPLASVGRELGPSNNARLRMYVRRLRAAGAGIAEEYLDLVRAALRHYGVPDLTPSDALERAVLRMLASQLDPQLRRRLVRAMIHRVTALAEAGVHLEADAELADALSRIAGMRGLVPDALADAAIDASQSLFVQPDVERRAVRTSRQVERWLAEAEREPTAPPTDVLLELASAPRRVFARVGRWIDDADPARRAVALAAHLQRLYAPRLPEAYSSTGMGDARIHRVHYPDGQEVVASVAAAKDLPQAARRFCEVGARLAARRGDGSVRALELLVPGEPGVDPTEPAAAVSEALADFALPCRLTVSLLSEDGAHLHQTFEPAARGTGVALRRDLHGVHPETAGRVDLARLAGFELERLPAEEGIHAFQGRSREVPGDERLFVLADVRGLTPGGPDATLHVPVFERAFFAATRTLRQALLERDPRRLLQWNRISLFVGPPLLLTRELAARLSRRLAPATRNLGLEKVVVRLRAVDPDDLAAPARPLEVVITDPRTGGELDVTWREPHRDPLRPASDYERRVVAARRRRLVYPYEIVRMLCGDSEALPGGSFEEYDLDPDSSRPLATSVAGRPYGRNESAVVFGIVTTPTDKVPEGMKRVLVLSDPTLGMGSLAGPECDRLVAAIDLAERLRVPLEWVPVSSGARIAMDSGTENLDATARVVRRIVEFTQAGGVMHVIVHGVNVGAQSYFDALATMLMHTRGVLVMTPGASMVLTGRAALEASGAVSAEDEVAIGGYERVMGPNGEAQYYARNLADAYRILYEHYRYTYVVPGEPGPRRHDTRDPAARSLADFPIEPSDGHGFRSVGDIFDDAVNTGRKRPFSMRSVMEALVDRDGGRLERWRDMVGAQTAIVWDAHLGGYPVCLVGIESHNVPRQGYRPLDGPESWTGGTLFPQSSKKVARALASASGNRPAVILANLSGFDGSPESLRKLQLEYGAEIARAVVNFEGPLLFLVVSRYHGGAYVVFSQELNEDLVAAALEGSYASVIGGGAAAAVVFTREVRARTARDRRVVDLQARLRREGTPEARAALDAALAEVALEKQAEIAAEFDAVHSVERAREVGSLDAILPAERMREWLVSEIAQAWAGDPKGAR